MAEMDSTSFRIKLQALVLTGLAAGISKETIKSALQWAAHVVDNAGV